MSDEVLYRVKRDLIKDKAYLIEVNKNKKGLNLKAWSKTPKEAYEDFNLREKEEKLLREKRLTDAKVKSRAFMCEFKGLLKRYDASIGWYCGDGSDMYGIYDESMKVSIDCFAFTICEGSEVDAGDIKLDK